MWLRQEFKEIKIESLSVRQQLDLLQNKEYVTCNINYLIQARLSLSQSDNYANSGFSVLSRLQQESGIACNNYIFIYSDIFSSSVVSNQET